MFNKKIQPLLMVLFCFQLQILCSDNVFENLIESEKRFDLDCFLDRYGFPQKLSDKIDACLKDDECKKVFEMPIRFNGIKVFSDQNDQNNFNYRHIIAWDDYYIKNGDIHRIINSRRLCNYIHKERLDRLSVAKKYIGVIHGEYKILAEEVREHFTVENDVSLKEIQQLAHLVKGTGYVDFAGKNLIRDEISGKLVFIDTENLSFSGIAVVDKIAGEMHPQNQLSLMLGLKLFLHDHLTKEAQDWLLQEIDTMRNSGSGYMGNVKRLTENSAYDDRDIDFEKVGEHFFIKRIKEARLKAID